VKTKTFNLFKNENKKLQPLKGKKNPSTSLRVKARMMHPPSSLIESIVSLKVKTMKG